MPTQGCQRASALCSTLRSSAAHAHEHADAEVFSPHAKANEVMLMSDSISHRVPMGHCSRCGHMLDAAVAAKSGGLGPSPGDITICIKCGHPMVFNDDMKPRELNDDEIKLFGMFF